MVAAPTDLAAFPCLEWLDLAHNKIAGPFPNLEGLPALRVLDLAGNNFSGSLPADLHLLLPALKRLDISENPRLWGIVDGVLILRLEKFNRLSGLARRKKPRSSHCRNIAVIRSYVGNTRQ